jgi:flagellar biosynthesis GTPase FlhF
LNNFALIFGGLGMGIFYAIWGDYTTILSENTTSGNINFNTWIILLAIPYMFFSIILLFLCLSKYTSIYLGNKSIYARRFIIFTSIFYIFIDFFYLLMSQGVISDDIWIFDPETSALNLLILLNLLNLIFYFIIIIAKRRPSTSRFSMNRVSNRLSSIDRRIEDADNFVSSARRGERDAQTQSRQEKERRKRQKERERERARSRKRQEQERIRQSKSRKTNKSYSAPRSKRSTSTSSSRTQRITSSSSTSSKKKELLRMRPKTGVLTKDDFKCIFCFELPTTSDGHRGIVVCPNCRYPAHVDEFKNWMRTSNLCSRCDGVIPSSFRRNPKVIPVKEYLRGYKFWKKKF